MDLEGERGWWVGVGSVVAGVEWGQRTGVQTFVVRGWYCRLKAASGLNNIDLLVRKHTLNGSGGTV